MAEKRKGDARDACALEARVVLPEQEKAEACVVSDISETGARIEIDHALDLPQHFTLALPVIGDLHDERPVELRWRAGGSAGVQFKRPV